MSEYDYVFVGGGINALVAAAMLGKKRRTTLVLERNSAIGGCLRTEEATAPGFLHDVMATTLVLFRTSPAYQALGKDLEARGFAFADTNLPTAVLRPDGSSVILSMDRARNVKTFDALAEGDGRRLRGRDGRARGGRAVSLRPVGRLAMVVRNRQDARARALAARPAQSCGMVRRGACARAGLSRGDLPLGRGPRPLGAVGAAHRPRTGERLFGGDGESDRFRDRGGGLSDRGRRRQDAGRRVRAADRRSRRRGASERGRCAHHPRTWLARGRRRACER